MLLDFLFFILIFLEHRCLSFSSYVVRIEYVSSSYFGLTVLL